MDIYEYSEIMKASTAREADGRLMPVNMILVHALLPIHSSPCSKFNIKDFIGPLMD